MKIQKQKKIKYLIISSLVVVLLVAGAVSAYALMPKPSPIEPTDTTTTSGSNDGKKDFIENTDKNGQSLDQPGTDPTKTVSFKLSETDSEVIVTTQLAGITEGTCTITVNEFSQSAPVLYQPEFSTCEGFAIKKTDIDTTAQFSLKVTTGNEDIVKTGYLNE
jgi:hypothetical protein